MFSVTAGGDRGPKRKRGRQEAEAEATKAVFGGGDGRVDRWVAWR